MIIPKLTDQQLKEHLLSRHVDFNVHRPAVGNGVATFPLYNLSGMYVGYQRYNPSYPSAGPGDGAQHHARDRRYYNYVTPGQIGVFGLETFDLDVPVVFVVEGVFDATRLTSRGACALAMLTNNPSCSMKNLLRCLGRPVIAVCDDDRAGSKLGQAGDHHEVVQGGKDLGNCSEDFVNYLLARYIR